MVIHSSVSSGSQQYLWGIDLGGTKIEGVVLQSVDPSIELIRKRIPTEANRGYEHIIRQIKLLAAQMADDLKIQPGLLGIGTPGSLDPNTQTLKNSNTTCLNGKMLKKDIEQALGISIVMANDANCFALAETKLGAVKQVKPDANLIFGVIMGTGVGGGIVVNGSVINGVHGIAGEWGHIFLDHSGGKCYCGKTGCVETIISGPALENHYLEQSGHQLSLSEIVRKYDDKKDEYATATIQRLIHFYGKGLSQVINILDPDIILIGGGVGNIDLLYTLGLEEVKKYVFNTSFTTPIIKPQLGDSAGVFGAALLATS
ncbi:ROK family protein [Fulvivirgaceae bacterium BMA10]|uniref:ROK family protein n=1 Tax=Splendidivirga corallicola TaxID=3051826 RepID=A0ABT8KSC5_9BACT|nr:ROK family protein [Fulvivirgaceae bacterium BMA10]